MARTVYAAEFIYLHSAASPLRACLAAAWTKHTDYPSVGTLPHRRAVTPSTGSPLKSPQTHWACPENVKTPDWIVNTKQSNDTTCAKKFFFFYFGYIF